MDVGLLLQQLEEEKAARRAAEQDYEARIAHLTLQNEELEQANRKLTEGADTRQKEKYQRIIENINLGLVEVDLNDRIVYTNQSFCRMSGYSAEELIGQVASEMFIQKRSLGIIQVKNQSRLDGVSDTYEVSVVNRRGESMWWLISGAPLYSETNEVIGSLGIHLDISKQKQLETELRLAKQDAERSSLAKENFLANMSHEIRTPMNAILSMGRQLTRTPLDHQQRFYLDTMNTAAGNLLVVINDILDFSKIEAGRLSLEHIGFNLAETVQRAVHVMLHRAEEKGLQLSVEIDPSIAPILLGDPFRLNQILLNLIGNAIKFTEKGSVQVQCFRQAGTDSTETIQLVVSDTGVGMNAEFLHHLFDKFTQEDESVGRRFGGTGLGMSISKQLVELIGGTIRVDSQKNVGTTVHIDLVYPVGTPTDLAQPEELLTDATILKGKRVLLVEDNAMNRLVATTVLQQYGADITDAVNGAVAVERLRNDSFDVVLMDVQMPVMDGLEATRVIREQLQLSIPIIALTANAIRGEQDRCLQAGMNDFVAKPFEEEILISLIAKWLGRDVTQSASFMPNEPTPVPVTDTTLYSITKLLEISVGNEEFVQQMLGLFCEEMPLAITELKTALQTGDLPQVKRTAHRMKPSIDTMDMPFKDEIRRIEALALTGEISPELTDLIDRLEDLIDKSIQHMQATV